MLKIRSLPVMELRDKDFTDYRDTKVIPRGVSVSCPGARNIP